MDKLLILQVVLEFGSLYVSLMPYIRCFSFLFQNVLLSFQDLVGFHYFGLFSVMLFYYKV